MQVVIFSRPSCIGTSQFSGALKQKSNLDYTISLIDSEARNKPTGRITTSRLQRWRAVNNSASDLIGPEIESRPPVPKANVRTAPANASKNIFLFIYSQLPTFFIFT